MKIRVSSLVLGLLLTLVILPSTQGTPPPPDDPTPKGHEGDPEDAEGLGDPAPEGQSAYSTFQARYREIAWSTFLDARVAAAKTGWTCQGLEDLGPDYPDTGGYRCDQFFLVWPLSYGLTGIFFWRGKR